MYVGNLKEMCVLSGDFINMYNTIPAASKIKINTDIF